MADRRGVLPSYRLPVTNPSALTHDADGLRIEKVEAEATTKFVYDGSSVILEKDGQGAIVASYVYGPVELLMVERGEDRCYYHSATNPRRASQDGLGTTVRLTDADGEVVNSYDYEAFGNIVSQTEIVENGYKFTGKELDEGGWYYFGARYYDPSVGEVYCPLTLSRMPAKKMTV